MFDWINHHGIILIIAFAIARNLVVALPKPGDSPASSGFGSASVGYSYFYRVAQGITLDLSAIGAQFDMRQMRERLVKGPIKSDGTPRINGEDTIVIPPKKD